MQTATMHRRKLLVTGGSASFASVLALRNGFASAAAVRPARAPTSPWRELWNGRDLMGWQTWMGRPAPSVPNLDLPRNTAGEYVGPLGLGKDPRGVYSVVRLQGERVLRISGEVFGALTSTDEFSDFHLRVEWRWGWLRWPPRQAERRDSGVLYHCTGEHGSSGPSYNWMRSLECQIQQGDCGDLWALGGAVADSRARLETDNEQKKSWIWDPQGQAVTVPAAVNPKAAAVEPRVRRGFDHEYAAGQWNTMEVLVQGDEAEHKVNGKTVLRLQRARVREGTGIAGTSQLPVGGRETPLVRGRLQIQSEGAEIFFRRIALRGLPTKAP